MAHAGYEQLTLGLFDTASPYSLSLGSAPAASAAEPKPISVIELPPAAVPVTWRLAGERTLAKDRPLRWPDQTDHGGGRSRGRTMRRDRPAPPEQTG